MAEVPLDLVATVVSVDPDDPEDTRRIRGQVAIASTPGRVRDIRVSPADPPVNPAVLEALAAADVVLGSLDELTPSAFESASSRRAR
jgi:2-phospho-L-lactate transferase/gluconeogenesis factor (CofD/UPF0052 family)